jgi:hypothetical protein
MTKKFERKCQYCGHVFGHWKSHWIHEKNCVKQEFDELVCRDPKCRGANLCTACRELLDRHGEPGRA